MEILIVEDNPVSMFVLENMLIKQGHKVVTAKDGQEAWEIYQNQFIQILITDWIMPRMDGLQLCMAIRSASKGHYTYIIVTSSKDHKEDLLEILNSGADDYITKPFDVEEIKARIKAGERITMLEENYKDLQQILIESRNKLRIVLDSLPQEIVSVDRDTRIVSVNSSFLTGKRVCFSDIVTSYCFQEKYWNMPLANIENIRAYSMHVFESGVSQSACETFNAANSETRHIEFYFLPIKHENGEVYQVAIVSRDITDEKQRIDEINSLNYQLRSAVDQIREKNEKLEKTLIQLKETQFQMLQTEKMASIGQLAAGVAHEINNPVGFVSSNLRTLTDYQQCMSKIIAEYSQLTARLSTINNSGMDVSAIEQAIAQIHEKETELDIDYIIEDIPHLILDSRDGLDRIKKIVLDLKNFSHPGDEILKSADINQILDSTLNIVWNELKYKVKISKDYSELPQVDCYPQQISQVFMNIMINAGQAIKNQGEIHIATHESGDYVEISISDTGQGIPEKYLSKIFDPFFTTKEVGKGTGLGLNVTYNIIQKHRGMIDVQSEVGTGTTFTIKLPVNSLSQTSRLSDI